MGRPLNLLSGEDPDAAVLDRTKLKTRASPILQGLLNVFDAPLTQNIHIMFYLEDFILVRLKRVQLQFKVPQIPKSHRLKKFKKETCKFQQLYLTN